MVKIGDKIRIFNGTSPDYYTNGAEGFVVKAYGDGRVDVKFTYGWLCEDDDSREFHVYKEEYEVISNESKTQTKREKEMENQSVKLKQGVYAVVETGSKSVVDVFTNRGAARYWMQGMKQEFPECSYKLAKLAVDKWIR